MRWFLAGLAGLFVVVAQAGTALAGESEALAYLEGLKGKPQPYIAPSKIDPRFTSALYVNVATSGPNKQRMWVLQRDATGAPWSLGMWDKDFWKKAKLPETATPPYSWPVSSGRVYRGDRKAGPTPAGIYGLDERKWRYGEGYLRAGMIHVMHIDFHYPDGRVTGVAFHGTTAGNYSRLGTNDSHGCIRMHQKNALALLHRMTGTDGTRAEDVRWGEVPRYWLSESGRVRKGYRQDGKPLPASLAEAVIAPALDNAAHGPSSDASGSSTSADVLLKTGFRTLVVIFED